MSRGGKQDKPDSKDQPAGSTSKLSALEGALREALASLPRDQVVKCIMSALPAEVFVGEDMRLHGGKVRKVSVSMPEELTEAVRTRTGPGGFSRYVSDAVQEQISHDMLGDLIAEFEAKHGPIPQDLVEKAMSEWPDEDE